MTSELDRYYTPTHVAKRAIEHLDLRKEPRSCADSTCGSGRLLDAATSVFGDVSCLGIDRDYTAIRNLRRRRPNWTLATGDLLSADAYEKSFSRLIPSSTDLLLMNPPFSHGNKKHVEISYEGESITGSTAMAYILRSFELLKPRYGAILIVPESLLFSETDEIARRVLSKRYSLRKLADLRNCTFRGARAHACIVQADPYTESPDDTAHPPVGKAVSISLSRGCLPVHAARIIRRGIPYLHSTDIKLLAAGDGISALLHTDTEGARKVSGWVVLIPRVGVPQMSAIRATHLDRSVRLSDCVIAIVCASRTAAMDVERRIRHSTESFLDLYKGTGARYLTMTRLRLWLAERNLVEAT